MKAVVLLLLLSVVARIEAAVVNCELGKPIFYYALGYLYTCTVRNDLNITAREFAIIESANPTPTQTVKFFSASSNTIQYFPQNLDKVFANLEGIIVDHCHLKEIRRDDLKPFSHLRTINFYANDIEFLEEDLFANNPQLEVVLASYNKISHIDPNIFDHLQKLSYLYLNANKCIAKDAHNSISAVKSLVSDLKSKCNNPQLAQLNLINDELKKTQTELRADSKKMEAKLEESMEELKSSQAEQKIELKDMKARMTALEAMTQKILEMVGNLTVAEEPDRSSNCDGEWND